MYTITPKSSKVVVEPEEQRTENDSTVCQSNDQKENEMPNDNQRNVQT